MLRTLLVSLIENKSIVTTLPKAKELKPFAEKKVTIAKRGLAGDALTKLAKLRLLKEDLPNQETVKKLFEIAERSKNRNGGYVRILKLMPRKSDSTDLALVEWVDGGKREETEKKTKESKKKEDKTREGGPSRKKAEEQGGKKEEASGKAKESEKNKTGQEKTEEK